MDLLEIAMIGIVAVVAVNVIAPRIKIASPLLLVLLGIVISFLPVVTPVEIEPEWILGGVLVTVLAGEPAQRRFRPGHAALGHRSDGDAVGSEWMSSHPARPSLLGDTFDR